MYPDMPILQCALRRIWLDALNESPPQLSIVSDSFSIQCDVLESVFDPDYVMPSTLAKEFNVCPYVF